MKFTSLFETDEMVKHLQDALHRLAMKNIGDGEHINVIYNYHTKPETLISLANRDWDYARHISHSTYHPSVLEHLSKDHDKYTRYAVVTNPFTSTDTLKKMLKDPMEHIRSAAQHKLEYRSKHIEDFHNLKRQHIYNNFRVDPHTKSEWKLNESDELKKAHREALDKLVNVDPVNIAYNPNTSPETLLRIASKDMYYASHVADATHHPEVLDALANHEDPSVRYSVACNHHTSVGTLKKLASSDSRAYIRIRACGSLARKRRGIKESAEIRKHLSDALDKLASNAAEERRQHGSD